MNTSITSSSWPGNDTSPTGLYLVNKFLLLLSTSFIEKKQVKHYARELAITPNHLNAVIKKTTGVPASHHIKERIILEAKRKVQLTGANMKEVAYYLGFDDMAHFSKYFKNVAGMKFTDFRRSYFEQHHMPRG